MANKLAPFPVGIPTSSSYWTDAYERIRFLINQLLTSISWGTITGTPTTLAGYGITDAAPLSHVGSGGTAHANATSSTAGFMSDTDKAKLDLVTSGTYSPTITGVANTSSVFGYDSQYIRVGSIVTVSGRVDVDPVAAATNTRVGISLPIASNFANANECCGTANSSAVVSECGAIIADTVNDRAQLTYVTSTTAANAMWYTFTYKII